MSSDKQNPYSYKNWLSLQENNLTDDPQKLYMDYLKNWYILNNKQLIDPKQKIKDEYLQLIKDLSFLFNKNEKDRFLQSIDYNNKEELIYSIPLFAKKLKEIAKVLNAKRNSIKNSKLKYSLIGSNDGVETLFYEYLLRSFTKNNNSITQIPTARLKYEFPSLSAVKDDFFIEIEELYDTNNYLDSDPEINVSEYLNVNDILDQYPFEDLTENDIVGILNSRFIPRAVNNSLSKVYQAYLTSLTGDFDNGDEKTKLLNYQINASEKYMGESLYGLTAIRLKDLDQPDFLLQTNFSEGNNWFIWPSGSKVIDDTLGDNYLSPILLTDSNLVSSGATGGSSYKDSDLIFTDKNGIVEGAWLRGIRSYSQNVSTSVNILPNNIREFIYPYVGYNLTTKGLNWIGHSLVDHDYRNYDLLSNEQKINLLTNYYTQSLPLSTSNSFYLNQSTFVDNGSEAGDNTLNSDAIIKRKHRNVIDQVSNASVGDNIEAAFLYKLQKTDIPISLGVNNIYWPIKTFDFYENIPITIKKDHSIPVPLANLKVSEVMSGSIAGLTFETSDIIYKLNNRYSDPIEAAWLGSGSINNLELNNDKSIAIYDTDALFCSTYIEGPTQASLNLKIGSSEKVSFIWCDIDTPADDVFKNFEHAPNCEYGKESHNYYDDQNYLNPEQLNQTNHWSKCTCKAVNYSPIGHIGDSPLDYNTNCDLLFADPEGLQDNFTLLSWQDTRKLTYKNSPQFAHFKIDGKEDNPIGWGKGNWKTGRGRKNAFGEEEQFILKTGRRYTYIRTSLRKDDSSSFEGDVVSPYYIVKYAYKELKGFCNSSNNSTANNCFDMFIVLDISKSQKLSLEDSKNLVINISKVLLKNSNNSVQIGVIAFNTDTNMLTYLTNSHGGLEFYVKNVEFVENYPVHKTDILNAITVAQDFLFNEFPKNATSNFKYTDLCSNLNTLIVDDTTKSKTLNLPRPSCAKKLLIISDGEENTNITTDVINYAKTLKSDKEVDIYTVDIGLRSYDNNLLETLASEPTKYYSLEGYLKEGNGDVLTFANILASNINGCNSVVPNWKKAVKNAAGIWTATNEKSDMVMRPGDFLIYVHSPQISYTSEDSNSSFTQNGISFTFNSKLNGWDYDLKKFDPKFIGEIYGGKPFWGVSDTIPVVDKKFEKESNHFSGQLRFFNDYVPLRQPEVSNIIIQNGSFIQYFRRNNTSFDWIQPITLTTTLSDYQWNKINFNRHTSNLSEILKNGDFDFYGESSDEVSDMLLESYSDFRISRYNYFARNAFTYTQELYNKDRCENTFVIFNTGSIITPSEPYCNLLNVHFPTIATVSIPKLMVSEKYFGGYLIPINLGVPYYRGKGYTIEIDKDQITVYDSTSAERTFFDPNKYANRNRGLTKKDQISPAVIKSVDNRWMVDSFNSGNRMGMHINTLENQKFTPYQSSYEVLGKSSHGVTRQDDPIEFWNNTLPAIWNDEKNYPLTFRKELMAQTYELRKTGLLVDRGVMTNWRTDIFGNEYGIFKPIVLPPVIPLPPTYKITPNTQTVSDNGNVVFYITTTNIPTDTTLYWSTKQISGTINGSDFSDSVLNGNVTIINNKGLISRTLNQDLTTEGQEQFAINLRTVSSSGTVVATSSTVTINDTSTTPSTYQLTSNKDSVNEPDSVTFTLTTTNVVNGTNVPYTISGVSPSDIGGAALTGNFVVDNNNTATLTLSITEDNFTENNESLVITAGGQSKTVTINDTSTTPSTVIPELPAPGPSSYTLENYSNIYWGDFIDNRSHRITAPQGILQSGTSVDITLSSGYDNSDTSSQSFFLYDLMDKTSSGPSWLHNNKQCSKTDWGTSYRVFNFSQPIKNPILSIYSLGSTSRTMNLYTRAIIDGVEIKWGILWTREDNYKLCSVDGKYIRGSEGYGVVIFVGTYSQITLISLTTEYYTNYCWGMAATNAIENNLYQC